MSGIGDFLRNLDYAVWLRSRGIGCEDIAQTFHVSVRFANEMTRKRAAQKGVALPQIGRPRKKRVVA